MNKTLYKVIFNKKRGQMVAVAEHTARAGKSTQDSAPGAALSASAGAALRLPAICFSLLLAFGQAWIVPAHAAGIAADKAAPANQQPTILQTANGLPQVNIQTPTSAGVSVNQYRQFDVDGKGAILNNSRSNTATHTGGWIQGNPWLAGGEARVIVNQINSSNPSQLGGYIEVAGRRAEVIMANPAGIQVNGGGFINAAGITLTSGRPIINNGHLEGFRVRSGSVDVSGNGLDTSGADYTRILAQAATVNAGIWAQDLQISAGSNDIAANGATTAVSDGPSLAAAVAVDTGALGGMYAGKISLISTEKGVGIHNAGQLFAAAGGVSLAADGEIVNSGSIVAADKSGSSSADKAAVAIQAAHFHNSGSLSAQGAARIQTASLNNSGLLASAAELNIRNQAALANSGRINAARLDMETGRLNHSGHTTQTGSQDLAIEAANLHNRAGGLIGYTPIDSGNNGASDQGNSSHPSAPPTTATGGGRTESAPAPTAPQALPAGRISVSDGLDNSGSISANGNTDLSTHQSLSNQGGLNLNRLSAAGRSLSNTSGRISAHSADIRTDTFRNHSGSLQSSDGLNIHTQTLDNHQGTLQSAGSLHINSTALRNPSGRIAAPSISLAAAQHLDNTGGSIDAERLNIKAQTLDNQSGHIRSNEFTELNLSDGLANHGGQISSAGQLSIHDNQQNTLSIRNLGEILAGEDARIQAQSLANSGRLAAGRDLSIALQHNFSSQADIEAGRRLSIESAGRLNNRHTLQGGESVHLSATDIDNSAGGNIQSGSTTHLSAAQSLSNRGLINSNGLTLIEAGTTLLNSGSGRIYGNHVALAATDLINRDEQEKSAAIAARRQLDIGAQNITNQEGTLLSSEGRLNIGAVALSEIFFRQADFQAGQRLMAARFAQQTGIVLGRPLDAGRVAFVETSHGVQQNGAVLGRARHRAALVERRGESDHPPARHHAVGGFQARQAAQRGGLADRTAGIGRSRGRCEPRGHCGRRAPRRTAGNAADVPRVLHRPVVGGLVRRAHGELVHVGLAEDHRAGGIAAFDHRRVVGRDEVVEHPRAAGGAPALGAENVFLRQRDAGQRAGLAARQALVGGTRLGQTLLGIDADEGVECWIVSGNAVEVELSQLDAGDFLRGQSGGQFSQAARDHSITFGTR